MLSIPNSLNSGGRRLNAVSRLYRPGMPVPLGPQPEGIMGVTDAINHGYAVGAWGNNSGAGPGSQGYQGSNGIDAHVDVVHGAPEYHGLAPFDAQFNDPEHPRTQMTSWGQEWGAAEKPSALRKINPLTGAIVARADGGPVRKGLPTLIGERGPELMVPKPGSGQGAGSRGLPHPLHVNAPLLHGMANFARLNPGTPTAADREFTKLATHPEIPMPIREPQFVQPLGQGAGSRVQGMPVPLAKRANGGPVRKGRPTLVGERGPEVIVPGQDGYVIPNEALSQTPDVYPIDQDATSSATGWGRRLHLVGDDRTDYMDDDEKRLFDQHITFTGGVPNEVAYNNDSQRKVMGFGTVATPPVHPRAPEAAVSLLTPEQMAMAAHRQFAAGNLHPTEYEQGLNALRDSHGDYEKVAAAHDLLLHDYQDSLKERADAQESARNPDGIIVGVTPRKPLTGDNSAFARPQRGMPVEDNGSGEPQLTPRAMRNVTKMLKNNPRQAMELWLRQQNGQAAADRFNIQQQAQAAARAETNRHNITTEQHGIDQAQAAKDKAQVDWQQQLYRDNYQETLKQLAEAAKFQSHQTIDPTTGQPDPYHYQTGTGAALDASGATNPHVVPLEGSKLLGVAYSGNKRIAGMPTMIQTAPAQPPIQTPSLNLPWMGQVMPGLPIPGTGKPAQYSEKPQQPKAPTTKNFGSEIAPDWREFNPETGKWHKVQFHNDGPAPDAGVKKPSGAFLSAVKVTE